MANERELAEGDTIVTKNAERATVVSSIIAEIEVREGEEIKAMLGTFSRHSKPKGFSLEVVPEVGWSQVVTKVTCAADGEDLTYWLHAVNQSSRVISIIAGQVGK